MTELGHLLVADGLLLQHGGQYFAVPSKHVLQIAELRAGEIKTVGRSRVAVLRGKCHAAVWLDEVLGMDPSGIARTGNCSGLVLCSNQDSVCLLAERVLGCRKIVVKAVDGVSAGTPKGIRVASSKTAGVAHLGGNRLAIVLNVPELLKSVHKRGDA